MNKYNKIYVALVIGLGLIMGGCGIGNKVSVSSNQMTVKTDEGEMRVATNGEVKIPENFPKEIMVGENVKPIVSVTSEKGSTVTYSTTTDRKTVSDELLKLTDKGWKKELELSSSDGMMLSFSKNGQKILVTVNEETDDGKKTTQVSIVVETEN